MGITVALECPRDVPHTARVTLDELRIEPAIHLCEQGRLSFGKARETAGVSACRFLQIPGARGIRVYYGLDEYEQDRETFSGLELP